MLRGLDASLDNNSLGISTYGLTCTSLEDVFMRICEGGMALNGQSHNQPSLNGMQGAEVAPGPHAEGDGAGGGGACWAGGGGVGGGRLLVQYSCLHITIKVNDF
jgi:hypothetical protein